MPRTTQNLGLILPLEPEYFDIDTWNRNMRILDEAYALLTDSEGGTMAIPSSAVSYDNSETEMQAENVQSAIDELTYHVIDTETREITIDSNTTIAVDTHGHTYLVLHFGDTVYDVTFTKLTPDSSIDFVWEGGIPTFQPNSTYELSFLRLDCMWFKR